MMHDQAKIFEIHRRTILKAAAGIAVSGLALTSRGGEIPNVWTDGTGQPGDFNFLAGEWKISHRQRKATGKDEWDEFTGDATCWTILGGIGSVEELRIPSKKFSGMGLRLLDIKNQIWNDFWVNANSGILTTPGQTGAFKNGVGTFTADDMDGETPIKVKGVWDRITDNSCRWYQAISTDGGTIWEDNWLMD